MAKRRVNYPIGFSIPLGQTVSNILTAEDLAGVGALSIAAPSVLTGVVTLQQKHSGLVFVLLQSPLGTSLQPAAGTSFSLTEVPMGGLRLQSAATELYHRNFALWADDAPSAGAQFASSVEALEGRRLIADLPVDGMGGLWIPSVEGLDVQTSLIDQFGQNNGSLDGPDIEISGGIIKLTGAASRVELGGNVDGSFADIVTGLTLVMVVRINTFTTANETIISKIAGFSASASAYNLTFRGQGGDNTYQFLWSDIVPFQQVLKGVGDEAIEGQLQSVIATHVSGQQRLYVDGVEIASAVVASNILSVDTAQLRLGAGLTTASGGIDDGEIHLASIINRELSQTEVPALHAELKRMFSELV